MRLHSTVLLSAIAVLAMSPVARADGDGDSKFKGKLMLGGAYSPGPDLTRTCSIKTIYTLQTSSGRAIWIFGSDSGGQRCDCAIYSSQAATTIDHLETTSLFKVIVDSMHERGSYLRCQDNNNVNVGAQTFIDLGDPSGKTAFELGQNN